MGLTEENRKDIVVYRIERAFTALEQAKGNLEMGYLEITANRLLSGLAKEKLGINPEI